MKRYLTLTFIIFLLFTGCRDTTPIKVGFVGALTGDFSSVGISSRNAIMLALETANNDGGINGKKIELIVRDDKSDPELTYAMTEELINEGISVIFGPTTSSAALSIQPLFGKEGIVFLSSTVSTMELDGIDDNLIRFISVKTRKDKITKLLLDYNGVEEVVVVNDLTNNKFAISYIDEIQPAYESRGGMIKKVITYVPQEDSAYGDTAEMIMNENPQGIIFLGDERNTALLCQQLKKKGYTGLLFTNAMTNSLVDHGGSAVDGLMMLSTFDSDSVDEEYLEVSRRYEERFSMKMNFAVKRAYEAAMTLIDALHRDPSMKNMKKTLLEKNTYPGLQGEIHLDQYGDVDRAMFLFILEDGKIKRMDEVL
ncbi:MAG: ABC transporter substrate-binding protein [Spirochaetales bacterium]|nr:ABC transporter substrate-binding protein [Spirochaetales bacterium]